jgi:KUP system potassium uptake protein
MALAAHGLSEASKRRAVIVLLGLFGAALLFGDGIITPAISVLSAIEGLKDGGLLGHAPADALAASAWEHHTQWLIVMITVGILIGLFSVQFLGTARVGRFFGPITALWFVSLAALGVPHLLRGPEILAAFNPWHGWHFLMTGGHAGFVILGSVFLAVTGGEALYADMGHFGASPIRRAWFMLVLPGCDAHARARACSCALLPNGTLMGRAASRVARHSGHGHRLTGSDHRHLFTDAQRCAARLPAAHQHPPHL